jgi:cell division protein FtsL
MRLRSKLSSLSLLAFLSISVASLFAIKHKVQGIYKEISKLNSSIIKEKETIHILNAEWAFLTQPSKVDKLASKQLSLEPMSSSNIKKLIIHKNSKIELSNSQPPVSPEDLT